MTDAKTGIKIGIVIRDAAVEIAGIIMKTIGAVAAEMTGAETSMTTGSVPDRLMKDLPAVFVRDYKAAEMRILMVMMIAEVMAAEDNSGSGFGSCRRQIVCILEYTRQSAAGSLLLWKNGIEKRLYTKTKGRICTNCQLQTFSNCGTLYMQETCIQYNKNVY
ncbi:MAG: hypothetical protein ACI39W_11545 [Brotaphodocola sp.]